MISSRPDLHPTGCLNKGQTSHYLWTLHCEIGVLLDIFERYILPIAFPFCLWCCYSQVLIIYTDIRFRGFSTCLLSQVEKMLSQSLVSLAIFAFFAFPCATSVIPETSLVERVDTKLPGTVLATIGDIEVQLPWPLKGKPSLKFTLNSPTTNYRPHEVPLTVTPGKDPTTHEPKWEHLSLTNGDILYTWDWIQHDGKELPDLNIRWYLWPYSKATDAAKKTSP